MTLRVDVFYSFRSPYSYLATGRMRELVERYDLAFNVRVVMPIAVRTPEFFSQVNPLWPPYLMRDMHRVAEFRGMPFRWPRPDPVVMDPATRTFPKEQPYIWPISRLGVAAAERGRGCEFTCEAAHVIWCGEVDDWHQGPHLARAAERAGLDLAELQKAVDADPAHFDASIEKNHKALEAAGHWGVPTFVFEGEPFFGQDRMDVLVWRLGQHGLAERS
ncbi:MAG: DsbA family protein [Myxococcota bacterium]